MIAMQQKLVFFLTPGYFFRVPDNSNLFRFPLKARVIGSRVYILWVLALNLDVTKHGRHLGFYPELEISLKGRELVIVCA